MAGVIFEDTVSDAGSSVMGGTRVYFVAWELTVAGPAVHNPNDWDTTQRLGVGHFQLGNDLEPGGIITGVGYGDVHWMNSEIGQWIVEPGAVGADFTSIIAQYVQWNLSPGTIVHLYVFGEI